MKETKNTCMNELEKMSRIKICSPTSQQSWETLIRQFVVMMTENIDREEPTKLNSVMVINLFMTSIF